MTLSEATTKKLYLFTLKKSNDLDKYEAILAIE